MLDEVQRAREAALRGFPLLLAERRVAAERADVADARGDGCPEPLVALGRLLVGARHVHVDVDAVLCLGVGVQAQKPGSS